MGSLSGTQGTVTNIVQEGERERATYTVYMNRWGGLGRFIEVYWRPRGPFHVHKVGVLAHPHWG